MSMVQKLELNWIGKHDPKNKISPEPRILVENPEYSYSNSEAIVNEQLSFGEETKNKTYFDNMLIHGDNLLALKSLELEYAGKIKCIYIDPPYNTGSAFEHYDDNLEHSAWLSLMKPRLELLKTLLSEDGSIFVQIDNSEQAYLKVLMDEVFGRSNFITTFSIKVRHPDRMLKGDKDIHDIIEYVHFYRKSGDFQISKKLKDQSNECDEYNYQINVEGKGKEIILSGKHCTMYKEDEFRIVKNLPNEKNLKKINIRGGLREGNSSGRFYVANIEKRINIDGFNVLYKVPDMGDDYLGYRYFLSRENDKKKNGHYFQGKPLTKKTSKEIPYPSFFDFSPEFNRVGYEGVVEFRNSKKPEALIKQLLELSTKPGDLVLDSFLGSGTTAAVAHKMGRRWIGIELGNHAYTHCYKRLKAVVDGEQGGISKDVNWKGGGGFKFYELAPSLIEKDKFGNPVISDNYTGEMLAEAIAKHKGYYYQPNAEFFWKQSKNGDKNFLYVTENHVTPQDLDYIHTLMKQDEHLLVCAPSYESECSNQFPNITIQQIPKVLFGKCDFMKEGYSLNVNQNKNSEEDNCNE